MMISKIIAAVIIMAGIALGVWLCVYVMLYGGIMQAIENWGIDNSKVVWGIIRAVFFELGLLPAYGIGFIGYVIWPTNHNRNIFG